MKTGPILAMVITLALGMWLVLQPATQQKPYDLEIRVASAELKLRAVNPDAPPDQRRYTVVEAPRALNLPAGSELDPRDLVALAGGMHDHWHDRPALERTLLQFFNISSWTNFAWVAVGLIGQCAFFGRMLIQWVISEKSGRSQVPEVFWWCSLIGGICLFTYFVWRVDVVGVLGQSTGMVIYARNLRLIHKQRRRAARAQP